MTTLTTEETGTAQAEKPKPGKKARVAPKRAHVGPRKAKTPTKAKVPKKARTAAKKVGPARDGSKAAKIIDLLKRPNGATLAEIIKATDWQAHSVRGFLSTAGKKQKLKIDSFKDEAGERTYKIAK